MQDINPEELENGNDHVHSAVGKMTGSLKHFQEITNRFPGDMLGGNPPFLQIRKIRFKIGLVVADGIGGKILCLKHFNKNR